MTFATVLAQTIPVFLVMAIGFTTRRVGILNEDAETRLMRLVLTVLYPCFILAKVPGNEHLQSSATVAIALLTGLLLTLAGFGLCYLVGKSIGLSRDAGLATFAVSAGLQNYGFLPIPLIEGIFSKEIADATLGVLFVHNLGVEIAIWTVGVVLISGDRKGAARRLVNGPTIAICVGLFLNFSGIWKLIPGVVNETVAKLAVCSIPTSLLLVGAALAGVVEKEKWRPDFRIIAAANGMRFLILPVLFFAAAAMSGFSEPLRRILLVQAAMPAAVFPIVLARFFGGQPRVAVNIVLSTSLFSVLLTPMILTGGFYWFGL
jgi:predicted permease